MISKQDRVLAFKPSNDAHPTYISKSEWRGEERLDIRTFYTTDSGERRPTKKGVSIPCEQIFEFLTALHEAIPDEFDAWMEIQQSLSDEVCEEYPDDYSSES